VVSDGAVAAKSAPISEPISVGNNRQPIDIAEAQFCAFFQTRVEIVE
jgi:hypothetical protein